MEAMGTDIMRLARRQTGHAQEWRFPWETRLGVGANLTLWELPSCIALELASPRFDNREDFG